LRRRVCYSTDQSNHLVHSSNRRFHHWYSVFGFETMQDATIVALGENTWSVSMGLDFDSVRIGDPKFQ
jgi:hypothetical protein